MANEEEVALNDIASVEKEIKSDPRPRPSPRLFSKRVFVVAITIGLAMSTILLSAKRNAGSETTLNNAETCKRCLEASKAVTNALETTSLVDIVAESFKSVCVLIQLTQPAHKMQCDSIAIYLKGAIVGPIKAILSEKLCHFSLMCSPPKGKETMTPCNRCMENVEFAREEILTESLKSALLESVKTLCTQPFLLQGFPMVPADQKTLSKILCATGGPAVTRITVGTLKALMSDARKFCGLAEACP